MISHRYALDVMWFATTRKEPGWTYIIMGKTGPTGKTTLCNQLKEAGYNAIEISEDINGLLVYRDDRNHYIVDELSKHVTVVLNVPVRTKGE